MNFDWKNWCRFCGNAENNVKFEYTIDIEYYFKISDSSPKICQQCSVSLREFEEFILKTERSNLLFTDLCNLKELNQYNINQIREKYFLDILELEGYTNSLVELNIKEDINSGCEQNYEDYEEYKLNAENLESLGSTESSKFSSSKSKQRKLRSTKQKSKAEKKVKDPKPKGDLKKVIKSEILPKDKVIPLVCHVCNLEFSVVHSLAEHTLNEHDCEIQLPCVCGHIITKARNFYEHRKKCCTVLVAPFKCDLCGNNYAKKKIIEKHMNEKHTANSVKHICSTCNRQFKFSNHLKKHEIIHLPQELRKIFRCTLCEKRYATKGQLKFHVATAHATNVEKNFTCHLCAKSYTTKSILHKHLASHLTTLNYQCNICSKKFRSKYMLKDHQRCHQEKNHVCEICNMAFKRSSTRNKHMITHTNERPYSCHDTSCNIKFKRREEADTHFKRVHLGIKRYVCKICGSDFNQTKERLEHMRLHHSLEYNEKYKLLNS